MVYAVSVVTGVILNRCNSERIEALDVMCDWIGNNGYSVIDSYTHGRDLVLVVD